MCFSADSTPPVARISGAAVDTRLLTLTAADDTRFAGTRHAAMGPGGPRCWCSPTCAGSFRFYQELAERFAERGFDSLAIDYFGRTAVWAPVMRRLTTSRMSDSPPTAVSRQTPPLQLLICDRCRTRRSSRSASASGEQLLASGGQRPRLAGAIGFYGHPDREFPPGSIPLVQRAGDITCPILGLMAGDDQGIPAEVVEKFRTALAAEGVDHELITYEGTPLIFRSQVRAVLRASADAWERVMRFVEAHK